METRSATRAILNQATDHPIEPKAQAVQRSKTGRPSTAMPVKQAASKQKTYGTKRRNILKLTKASPPPPKQPPATKVKSTRQKPRASVGDTASGSVAPAQSTGRSGKRKKTPARPRKKQTSAAALEIVDIDYSADDPSLDNAYADTEGPQKRRRLETALDTSPEMNDVSRTPQSPQRRSMFTPTGSESSVETKSNVSDVQDGSVLPVVGAEDLSHTNVSFEEPLPDNERDLQSTLEKLRQQCSRVEQRLQTCRGTRPRSTASETVFVDLTEGPDAIDDDSVSSEPLAGYAHPTSALVRQMGEENQDLRTKLSEQYEELREIKEISDSRLKELQDHQHTSSRADTYSPSDCIGAVEALNNGIESFCLYANGVGYFLP